MMHNYEHGAITLHRMIYFRHCAVGIPINAVIELQLHGYLLALCGSHVLYGWGAVSAIACMFSNSYFRWGDCWDV